MAVDKTEPPTRVIITVAVLSIGILVTLRVFFVSYFNSSYGYRHQEHIDAMMHGGSYVWTASRARTEEGRRLTRLPAAMSAIGRGQRDPAISPTASTDIAPLQGWTLQQREVPRPAPAAPPVVEPPVTVPTAAAVHVVPVPAAAPAHPLVAPGAAPGAH